MINAARAAAPDLLTPILNRRSRSNPFALPVRFAPGWLVVCPELTAAAQRHGFCVSALIHRHAALDYVQTPRRNRRSRSNRDAAESSLARTARHLNRRSVVRNVVSCFYTAAAMVSLRTRHVPLYAFNQTIATLGRPTP